MYGIVFVSEDESGNEVKATIEFSKEAFNESIKAFCELEGYSPDMQISPGMFTINQILSFIKQKVEYNITRIAQETAKNEISQAIEGLKESINLY